MKEEILFRLGYLWYLQMHTQHNYRRLHWPWGLVVARRRSLSPLPSIVNEVLGSYIVSSPLRTYFWPGISGRYLWSTGCYSTQDLGHGIEYHWTNSTRIFWSIPGPLSAYRMCTRLSMGVVSLTRHENLSTRLTMGWIYSIWLSVQTNHIFTTLTSLGYQITPTRALATTAITAITNTSKCFTSQSFPQPGSSCNRKFNPAIEKPQQQFGIRI